MIGLHKSVFQTSEYVIPPNQEITRTLIPSTYFRVVSSQGKIFSAELDNKDQFEVSAGIAVETQDGELWTHLRLRNPHPVPLRIRIMYGRGKIDDKTLSIVAGIQGEGLMIASPSGMETGIIACPGEIHDGSKRISQIVITCIDDTDGCYLRPTDDDTDDGSGIYLGPGEQITLPYTGPLHVWSPEPGTQVSVTHFFFQD